MISFDFLLDFIIPLAAILQIFQNQTFSNSMRENYGSSRLGLSKHVKNMDLHKTEWKSIIWKSIKFVIFLQITRGILISTECFSYAWYLFIKNDAMINTTY